MYYIHIDNYRLSNNFSTQDNFNESPLIFTLTFQLGTLRNTHLTNTITTTLSRWSLR